jgi:hypothetical protein
MTTIIQKPKKLTPGLNIYIQGGRRRDPRRRGAATSGPRRCRLLHVHVKLIGADTL